MVLRLDVKTLQFGDVVELLYKVQSEEYSWGPPRVVIHVAAWSLRTAEIVKSDGNTYLAPPTTGTESLRLIKGIGRWTLDEVVNAATAGLGIAVEDKAYEQMRKIYSRDAAEGPVRYHFRWPEGSESVRDA